MQVTNWKHAEDTRMPPDDSVAIAAESKYIHQAIVEARMHLNDADIAAGAESLYKAKQHIQSALEVLADLVVED